MEKLNVGEMVQTLSNERSAVIVKALSCGYIVQYDNGVNNFCIKSDLRKDDSGTNKFEIKGRSFKPGDVVSIEETQKNKKKEIQLGVITRKCEDMDNCYIIQLPDGTSIRRCDLFLNNSQLPTF